MPHRRFEHRPLHAQSAPSSKPKREWVVLPFLWAGLKRLAMGIGFLVLVQFMLVLFLLPGFLKSTAPSFPDEMVLFLPLEGGFEDIPAEAGLADAFAPPALSVREIVNAIDAATADDRVQGILARMNAGNFGLVHAREIHAALDRFRAAGKFAHIYSSSYGDGGAGIGRYYLASGFDQIWMQPLGVVSIPGVNAEMPFLRGVLDRFGVKPQIFKREDYKTAYENVTDRGISRENKEMLERLIGDIRAEILDVVPARRGIEVAAFEALVDQGLFTALEAQEHGLINRADYADVLVGDIKEMITGDREAENDDVFVGFDSYARNHVADSAGKSRVALVHVDGAIMPNDGNASPVPGGGVAAADKIAVAILNAKDDDDVAAIVLRVDSPGGSPTASESILRAVQQTQKAGKLVIVSMGNAAASGGYWVSASADQIFVQPSTITGSIGVVGGKFDLGGLWGKIGVNWDGVNWGANSGIWSFNESFSRSEAERFNAMLDAVYNAFLARVSAGRGMSMDEVRAIAGGRVWSGARAVEIGLADQIGGLAEALDYAAVQIGEKSRADLDVVVLPEPESPLEAFLSLLDGQARLGQAVRENEGLLRVLEPVAEHFSRVQNPRDFSVYAPVSVR